MKSTAPDSARPTGRPAEEFLAELAYPGASLYNSFHLLEVTA